MQHCVEIVQHNNLILLQLTSNYIFEIRPQGKHCSNLNWLRLVLWLFLVYPSIFV